MKKRLITLLMVTMCGLQLAACGTSDVEVETLDGEDISSEEVSVSEDTESASGVSEDAGYGQDALELTSASEENNINFKDFALYSNMIYGLTSDNELVFGSVGSSFSDPIAVSDAEEIAFTAGNFAVVKNTDGTYSAYIMNGENVVCDHEAYSDVTGEIIYIDANGYVYSLDGTKLYVSKKDDFTNLPAQYAEISANAGENYVDKELKNVYVDGEGLYFVFADGNISKMVGSANKQSDSVVLSMQELHLANTDSIYSYCSSCGAAYADATDTANITIYEYLTEAKESKAILPEGYTTANVKEAYFGSRDGIVIFDDGSVYVYDGNFDEPEYSEELTGYYANGNIQKIDSDVDVFFLMDDGQIYNLD